MVGCSPWLEGNRGISLEVACRERVIFSLFSVERFGAKTSAKREKSARLARVGNFLRPSPSRTSRSTPTSCFVCPIKREELASVLQTTREANEMQEECHCTQVLQATFLHSVQKRKGRPRLPVL